MAATKQEFLDILNTKIVAHFLLFQKTKMSLTR